MLANVFFKYAPYACVNANAICTSIRPIFLEAIRNSEVRERPGFSSLVDDLPKSWYSHCVDIEARILLRLCFPLAARAVVVADRTESNQRLIIIKSP